MQILTDNNVVRFNGTIEKGIFPPDPSRELYKIANDNGEFYAVTEGFILHEVDTLPEDYEEMKYLYTEADGFTLNPDWKDPNAPTEADQLRADVDFIAAMTGLEL